MPINRAHRYPRILAVLTATSIIAGLFLLASQPGAGSLFPPPWDKLAHFVTFTTLAASIKLGLPRTGDWKIFVFVCLVGIADETHQRFIPGRTAGIDDAMADFAGALVGLSLIAALLRKRT